MTTERKVIGGLTLLTFILLAGVVFFLTRAANTPAVPKDQIIAKSGLHWHPKIKVFIKNEKQPFKNGIGLSGPVHNPIHTHVDADEDIIHMEFEGLVTNDDTKLSNFFKIWGKKFTSTQLFDKTTGVDGKVSMKVNGKESQEFGNYMMKDNDNIEIRFE